MSRPSRPAPKERVVDWPNTRSEDPAAEMARQFTLNLRAAIAGRAIREVSRLTDVDHTTILNIVEGRSWATIETVSKLEHGLDVPLMPPYVPDGSN